MFILVVSGPSRVVPTIRVLQLHAATLLVINSSLIYTLFQKCYAQLKSLTFIPEYDVHVMYANATNTNSKVNKLTNWLDSMCRYAMMALAHASRFIHWLSDSERWSVDSHWVTDTVSIKTDQWPPQWRHALIQFPCRVGVRDPDSNPIGHLGVNHPAIVREIPHFGFFSRIFARTSRISGFISK